jgi:hypothetical protein
LVKTTAVGVPKNRFKGEINPINNSDLTSKTVLIEYFLAQIQTAIQGITSVSQTLREHERGIITNVERAIAYQENAIADKRNR